MTQPGFIGRSAEPVVPILHEHRPGTALRDKVLVASWVGIVSAACSSVGSGADGSSANTYRHATAYGCAAVNAAAIDACVMNTNTAYASASTAICERIS
jgi:hypothetical protein